MADVATQQLTNFRACTFELFAALEAVHKGQASSVRAPEVVTRELLDVNTSMLAAIDKVEQRRVRHQRIEAVERSLAGEVRTIVDLARRLKKAKDLLQDIIDKTRPKLKSMQTASERPVDIEAIVAYAHQIHSHASAPPSTTPPWPPIVHPTPAMMSAGRLYTSPPESIQAQLLGMVGVIEAPQSPTEEPIADADEGEADAAAEVEVEVDVAMLVPSRKRRRVAEDDDTAQNAPKRAKR